MICLTGRTAAWKYCAAKQILAFLSGRKQKEQFATNPFTATLKLETALSLKVLTLDSIPTICYPRKKLAFIFMGVYRILKRGGAVGVVCHNI